MFTLDNTLLVMIDVQGKLAGLMYDREKLYKNLETIVKAMNKLKIPIIWMEQVPEKLGPTIDQVACNLSDIEPIPKHTFSCCDNDRFQKKLKKIKRKNILVAGIETHICVFQTGYDLINSGYEVGVISDCVSSRTQSNKTIGLERMKMSGVIITSVEMTLFELMKSTKAEGFRDITRLIK